LCTFEIALPPLRERTDDIPLLANFFASQVGDGRAVLAESTLAELRRRPWFGNVRELRKAVEHALVLARRGHVLPAHLPPPLPAFGPTAAGTQIVDGPELARAASKLAHELLADPKLAGAVYDRFLAEVEPSLLTTAMNQAGNQCAPAARALGLHRTTLRRKLDQYGIADSTDGGAEQQVGEGRLD
jgi:two-component system nitrogen regulation response regulator GlnG